METKRNIRKRIHFIDDIRGITIISMVAFHVSYDLAYLYGLPMAWFTIGPLQDIWRCSISWTFLFIAGWSTSFSKSNLKRGCLYTAMALLVWLATTVASVDTPVNYGILFCMGASTLLYSCIEKLGLRNPLLITVMALVAFALSYSVPRMRYPVEHLAWLGFPSPAFMSGDYYPLIPYFFMYMVGAGCARLFERKTRGAYPQWMTKTRSKALEYIGTKSLIIYLLHQPLALFVLSLIFG